MLSRKEYALGGCSSACTLYILPSFLYPVMIDEEKAISMLGSKSVGEIAERIIDKLAESHKNKADSMFLWSLRSHMVEVDTEEGQEKLMAIINSNSNESNPDDFTSQPGLVKITKEFVNELVRELNQKDTIPEVRPEKKVKKEQITKKKTTGDRGPDNNNNNKTEEVLIKRLKDLIEKDSPESEMKKTTESKEAVESETKEPQGNLRCVSINQKDTEEEESLEDLDKKATKESENAALVSRLSEVVEKNKKLHEEIKRLKQEMSTALHNIKLCQEEKKAYSRKLTQLSEDMRYYFSTSKKQKIKSLLSIIKTMKDKRGIIKTIELIKILEWKKAVVHKNLNRLIKLNIVSKRSTGVYSLANEVLQINDDNELKQLLLAKMIAEELKNL